MTIEELARRVADLEQELRDNRTKLSGEKREIYERLRKIENQNARTDEQYKTIMSELTEQKDQLKDILFRLEKLSEKPAKRWDTAITTAISGLVGAIVGFVTTKIFGGG